MKIFGKILLCIIFSSVINVSAGEKIYNPLSLKETAIQSITKEIVAHINKLAIKDPTAFNRETESIVKKLLSLPVDLQMEISTTIIKDMPGKEWNLPGKVSAQALSATRHLRADNLLDLLRTFIDRTMSGYNKTQLIKFVVEHNTQLFHAFPFLVLRADLDKTKEENWILQLLPYANDLDKFTALYYLANSFVPNSDRQKGLEFLLKSGVNPNIPYRGRTLLSYLKEKQKGYAVAPEPDAANIYKKYYDNYEAAIKLLETYKATE